MRLREGRGWLLRTGLDGPWSGWLTLRRLDAAMPLQQCPWMALEGLIEVAEAFPGGLALVWDAPVAWLSALPLELRPTFLASLSRIAKGGLHLKDSAFLPYLGSPLPVWFHQAEAPAGDLGLAWRQGYVGWVPQEGPSWSLPGFGPVSGESTQEGGLEPGAFWGELLLPCGALSELDALELARNLGEAQACLERELSQRMGCGAWPAAFPFQRRRCGWRVGLLGGREFLAAGGSWERLAEAVKALLETLRGALRVPVLAGASEDSEAARLLGFQAMSEGLPWRASLPLPPGLPSFTPGLAADPRDPVPLETRCSFPTPLRGLLAHPPVALLRVPHVPQQGTVQAFLRGQDQPPALRWLPPSVPPPGPHSSDRPWAPPEAYPPLLDGTQGIQTSLFEEWDA